VVRGGRSRGQERWNAADGGTGDEIHPRRRQRRGGRGRQGGRRRVGEMRRRLGGMRRREQSGWVGAILGMTRLTAMAC